MTFKIPTELDTEVARKVDETSSILGQVKRAYFSAPLRMIGDRVKAFCEWSAQTHIRDRFHWSVCSPIRSVNPSAKHS